MQRYQKHTRNATGWGWTNHLAILFALLFMGLISSPAAAQSENVIAPPQFFLLPTERSAVVLQTHTADFSLNQQAETVFTSADIFYRLRNPGQEPISLTLVVSAHSAAEPVPVAMLPGDFAITAAGAPLAMESDENGANFVRVQVAADSRLDLRMSYTLDLGDEPVLAVGYPVAVLDAWPGSISLRTTIALPGSMPPESWLTVAPEPWTYAPPAADSETGVQWLFEGRLPATPILMRVIHPRTWQRIVAAEADLNAGQFAGAYVQLGDLYAQLAVSVDDSASRDRFYAQALAAFTSAVRAGGAPGDVALAQLGQAALYRQRLLAANGAVDATYARLLVDAAARALVALPPDNSRRAELSQWLNDGLNIALSDARNRRDWPTALATLDQVAALPPGLVDPQIVSDERRRVVLEQSLQMLEEGQRDDAVAVSGSGIVDANLQPPIDSQSLFAAWQVTATISPRATELHFAAIPAPGVQDAARLKLEELAGRLHEAASAVGGSVTLLPEFDVHVTLPPGTSGLGMSNATPLDANWALVRALLAQIAPSSDQESSLLRRNETLEQVLDLRDVGDQWRRMARSLEEQVTQFDAQRTPSDRSDPVALEAALAARIRAANYRAVANTWLGLAENTRLVTQLTGQRAAPGDGRAWQITVDDPPQTLLYESQTINWVGVWLLAGFALGGLLLLAGLMWLLL